VRRDDIGLNSFFPQFLASELAFVL